MWTGKLNFEAGGHLVAVEYDDKTAEALRERCARWVTSDTSDIPAAFGVRGARVGSRRRWVGVVHHGAPVRDRLAGIDAAVDAIATILGDFERDVPDGQVAIAARAFVRNGRVALLDLPLSVDVDERPLQSRGIAEIPTWRPLVDPSTGRVTVGDRALPLAGFVLAYPAVADLDSARRHVWSLGTGPRLPWAEFIDGLGERVVYDVESIDDALDRALS